MNDTILIIGNGFDLQCGLKSSYNDFFEFNKHNNEAYEMYFFNKYGFMQYVKSNASIEFDKRFSIWDMLFILRSDNNYNKWCDIESVILDTFKIRVYDLSDRHIKGCLWQGVRIIYDFSIEGNYNAINSIQDGVEKNLGIYLDYRFSEHLNKLDLNQFIEILYNHLEYFESRFAEYLKDQINEEYCNNAINLFYKLLTLDNEALNHNNNNMVISFNYTNHKDILINKGYCSDYINVHGDINNELSDTIFGIDDYKLQSERDKYLSEAIIFSKSFRIMNNITKQGGLINSILKPGIKNIVIYGHSLNEADYSYFQSIFDYYNLYSSDVKLWFAYSKHEGFNIGNYIKRIRNLISTYGQTLDNKDHGKNLFHKLLLEGRITIKEV